VADKGELLALIALSGLRRVTEGIPEIPIIETRLYQVFRQAIIDAYLEVERNPETLSIEEDVNASKVYDFEKGVVAQDGETYIFQARDIIIRSNQELGVLINLEPNSRFTVDAGVPYTCSALRQVKQVTVIPSVLTRVRIFVAGKNMGKVA